MQLVECVVLPDGRINGQTASSLNLRWRYGINLLAVSRQGQSMKTRLSRVKITAGDVLIVEGERESLGEVLSVLGCLPLADRDLRIGNDRRVWAGVGLFGTAIAMSAFGWVPIHISFVACVLVMAGVSMISARDAYRAIDWPIILLLGAMIPVGTALETSGGRTHRQHAGRLAGDAAGVGWSPCWSSP
ncbi:cation:proton antiporter regulatory subunit [Polycyclovorans algicola]|uniref:cation:proton antiporter regulatory subunit n=1 Tax=Polycyclovorans algicola TaxID=616992 RepID=UPI000693E2AE|nr:SLC13 family permease [Polycyclovorans algicola]